MKSKKTYSAHDLMAALADIRLFHMLVKAGHVDLRKGDATLENAFLKSVALLEEYVRCDCDNKQHALGQSAFEPSSFV